MSCGNLSLELRLKSIYSATETNYKIVIVASGDLQKLNNKGADQTERSADTHRLVLAFVVCIGPFMGQINEHSWVSGYHVLTILNYNDYVINLLIFTLRTTKFT